MFYSFKNYLIEFELEKESVLNECSHGYLMTLWDLYENNYIQYCEKNGYEYEDLGEF